jgi:hypothetical protein
MDKNKIKAFLRESLFSRIKEAPKEQSQKEPKPANKKRKSHDKEYAEVQNKLRDTMLKQSQVMAAAGLGDPDDATARSLLSKKVRKDTNDEGGQYLFDDQELAKVVKVLNNPAAYLNVKNKAQN